MAASITLAILAAALLLPSLFYPLARDQGVFAYAGSVILKGGWPYRDIWDLKPPAIYYTYAAVVGCFGHSMAALRAFDLIAALITASLLRSALSGLVSAEAAWLGALLYPALYLRLGFWGMAQAESYANLCTVAALAAWLQGTGVQAFGRSGVRAFGRSGIQDRAANRPIRSSSHPVIRSSVAAGLAAAAAVLFKVTALPPLGVALALVSAQRGSRAGWRAEARRWAAFFVALLVPLALVAAAMAGSGAGEAYLQIQRGFVAGYVRLPVGGAAAAGWRYFWRLYSLPAVLAIAGLLAASSFARILLGAWLAAAVASVAVQRKYFGYHWTPVLLPLAALAGLALSAGIHSVSASCPSRLRVHVRHRWVVSAVGALLITGWGVARPQNGYAETARLLTGRMRLDRYWARFGRPYHGDFSFLADRWAAAYIRQHTRPRDPVYIWGFEPLTLFLADRYAPTRFIFDVPQVSPWCPPRWRAELLADLRAHPPVLFGVMRHDAIPHASGRTDDSAAQLEQFPALRDFLRHDYQREVVIEDLTLYRRCRPPP